MEQQNQEVGVEVDQVLPLAARPPVLAPVVEQVDTAGVALPVLVREVRLVVREMEDAVALLIMAV